jgi:hypothetical protein
MRVTARNPQRTVRLVEIAELLGVSRQWAHQVVGKPGFPRPVGRYERGRLWGPARGAGVDRGAAGDLARGGRLTWPFALRWPRFQAVGRCTFEVSDRAHTTVLITGAVGGRFVAVRPGGCRRSSQDEEALLLTA